MSGKGVAGRITKNKKKNYQLGDKIRGEKAVEIAKAVGLAATTVRTWDKIREAAKSATSLDAKTMSNFEGVEETDIN